MKVTPKINAAYWSTIIVGSVFGANVGDLLSDSLGLGHLRGLPVLAVLLISILLAERFVTVGGALFYWAAIIVIRAAATNIGDSLQDVGVGFKWSIPGTALLLAVVIAGASARASRAGGDGRIRVDILYWIAMILAGALGTIAGDCVSYSLHMGNLGAILGFGLALAIVFAVARHTVAITAGLYWTAIVLIRSFGTAAGDLIANRFLGIEISTVATGIAFLALVFAFYRRDAAATDRDIDAARVSAATEN